MDHRLTNALAGLIAAIAAGTSFADCNPPCRNGKVCRYDSTHNPQFFCRKPPSAQSAAKAAPAPAAAGDPAKRAVAKTAPNKASAPYNPKELGIDRKK